MKKLFVYSALVLCGTALSVVGFNTLKDNVKEDVISSTNDFMNEKKGINKINVKKASKSSKKFNSSNIYVQTATDEEGYDYLRFATAIKGNFTNVSYTRHIDGLTDKTDVVTTLYKGITANSEDNFFNGTKLLNKNVTSTSDYYWACYTIKFVTDTYKNSDISITFKVDDYEATRTTSLYANTIDSDSTLYDCIDSEYNVVTLGENINNGGYGYIQGLCNDNENLYYTLSNHNMITKIVKRNIKTGVEEVIANNIKLSNNTPDAGHIRLINNKFYILTNEHKLVCYDLSTNAVIDNDLVFSGLEGTLLDFDFIESRNQFATLNTNGLIQFYGLDMKVVSTIKITAVSGYKLKSFRFDKEHIYVASNKNDERTIAINIYDYAGNIVSTYNVTSAMFLSSYSTNFNVSNFLFFNNKLYISALTWTEPTYSGLYELDYVVNKATESKRTWEEQYRFVNLQGNEYKFNTLSDPFKVNSKRNIQGACTDYSGSRYAYYAFNDAANNNGVIAKFDFVNNEVVGYSKEYVACKNNGEYISDNANIFYYEGKIFIIKTDGTFASVNASDITGNGVGEVTSSDESLKFLNASGESLTGITSVAYSNVEEKFAVIASSNLYIYSKDLKLLTSGNGTYVGSKQTLYVDGNKLYFVSGEGKGSYQETTTDSEGTSTTTKYQYNYINIVKLNWDGTKSGNTITLGDKTNPIGDIYEGDAKRNVRNMVVVDGNLYVATLSWEWIDGKSDGAMIHKFVITNENTINGLSLGEYAEINKEYNFEANAYIKNSTFAGNYIQGITTDGDNLYLAYTNTKNKEITIVRNNPVTNELTKGTTYELKTTDANADTDTIDNSDAGKIFFYNNQVWVVKYRSNQVFGINKDTLVASGDTMTFALPDGVNAFDVKYNEANELFVVYGSDGKIYMFSDPNTLVNTPFSVGANKKSITINDSYIYVNSSSNNQQYLTVETYDYNGKKVINAFKLSADNICDASVVDSFNTQAFIEYKGLIIMVALGWKDANNGGHVYAITMK